MAMKKEEPKRRGGRLVELAFRPATGGAISEMRTEYKRSGQGGGPDADYDHEVTVHPTLQHVQDHIRKNMGHLFPPAGSSEEDEHEEPEE